MAELSVSRPPVAARHLVAIAGSTGGMEALHVILGALPSGFPAAVAIVQHRMAAHDEILCELLRNWTPLDVRDARHGELLVAGTIFIAPADRHMTVTPDRTIALVAGPPIHHVLSSADPLFESAARVFGSRFTAVVVTGGDGDGSTGVRAVKLHGGTVLAQDPASAASPGMPLSAIATGTVDRVLPLEAIAGALVARVTETLDGGRPQAVRS